MGAKAYCTLAVLIAIQSQFSMAASKNCTFDKVLQREYPDSAALIDLSRYLVGGVKDRLVKAVIKEFDEKGSLNKWSLVLFEGGRPVSIDTHFHDGELDEVSLVWNEGNLIEEKNEMVKPSKALRYRDRYFYKNNVLYKFQHSTQMHDEAGSAYVGDNFDFIQCKPAKYGHVIGVLRTFETPKGLKPGNMQVMHYDKEGRLVFLSNSLDVIKNTGGSYQEQDLERLASQRTVPALASNPHFLDNWKVNRSQVVYHGEPAIQVSYDDARAVDKRKNEFYTVSGQSLGGDGYSLSYLYDENGNVTREVQLSREWRGGVMTEYQLVTEVQYEYAL
jgi:hypothetical protein